jgi:NAD(P)-dependent dehydrogenase (short-subunit alcohol dehydrogenase family)
MRCIITGASRGIGLELARQLAARGDTVVGTSTGPAPTGDDVIWDQLDVTDALAVRAFAARHGEPLDLLVCNAGVYLDKLQDLETGFDVDMWAQSLAVNVTGVFLTVQALLPQLRAAPAARIAVIGSQMGSDTNAPGGSFIYRASKAAALNLGRNLAAELKPEDIAVGIYHPGWVQTDMGGKAADLTPSKSATGLIARFDMLSPATTGCFETWDGRTQPY